MTVWSEAPQSVIHIAQELIEKYHPWLKEANIGFICRDKAAKSKGLYVFAQASKVPDKLKVVLDYDFLVWVSLEDWEDMVSETKEALIDHELSHCAGHPYAWRIRGHDFEDFTHIIARHGYWTPALKTIENAGVLHSVYQLQLIEQAIERRQGKVEAVDPSKLDHTDTPPAEETKEESPKEEPKSDPSQDPFKDFLDGLDKGGDS
jgi:hypothetical protein